MEPVTLESRNSVAILTINNPPVNAVSPQVVHGLAKCVAAFEEDETHAALVIACAGSTFVAGGDISAFDEPGFSAAPFNDVLGRIEALYRPVVAALHGTVLGGGLELALACHWRLADDSTRLGFPEVNLGLLPGSLGTQRLPRLIGVEAALDLIAGGNAISGGKALQLGLVDRLFPGEIEERAIEFALRVVASNAEPRRLSRLSVDAQHLSSDYFDEKAIETTRRRPGHLAPRAIVGAMEAAVRRPFEQGAAIEAKLFEDLRASTESKALRHLFFAQREAKKIPGLAKGLKARDVGAVGVLGAGTMGRGIAMNFLNAGIPVVLVETTPQALNAAVEAVRHLYEASAAKGKLSHGQVTQRMSLLSGALSYDAFADCDLVIEAVFEDLELKKRVMARLGEACKRGAIIATNTSTLDVDVLAGETQRPADVVGLHFFSPANVMRLLEVVRGRDTSPEVLFTVMQLARRIGKVAVVSGVCYGFIGNRMAEVYMREAEFLMMEGASPAQVDAAVEALGMAMGPCRMLDMAGIDVGAKTVIEYGRAGGLPPDPTYRALARRQYELGRFGQKTGAGYYRYEGRKAVEDQETRRIAEALSNEHGIERRSGIDENEIAERLLYPMVNEAARILEEGIAYRGGDIDVVWTAGYGFPDYRGGPLFHADQQGLPKIVSRLEHYGRLRGNSFGYWSVSPLLTRLAETNESISTWRANQ
ncbi:MAG: enoyl-CoA hydratase [Hyphomicrobiales bacterium]|nr:MAG: enoyl-CoA hydratase [Hyphomicrobiales bacterium]